ncbi:MAG TPA: hypothetical protein VJ548_07060 [Azospira sp.]|nr:hypothetical protein [Azospira sp.]
MSFMTGALLGILEDSATAILTLAEGLGQEEFFATQLTRDEVLRQLLTLADTALEIPQEVRAAMPEIDWDGWFVLGRELRGQRKADQGALWFGIRTLVPATLLWLRVYRRNQPELFDFKP